MRRDTCFSYQRRHAITVTQLQRREKLIGSATQLQRRGKPIDSVLKLCELGNFIFHITHAVHTQGSKFYNFPSKPTVLSAKHKTNRVCLGEQVSNPQPGHSTPPQGVLFLSTGNYNKIEIRENRTTASKHHHPTFKHHTRRRELRLPSRNRMAEYTFWTPNTD